jgi:hypothetical protein
MTVGSSQGRTIGKSVHLKVDQNLGKPVRLQGLVLCFADRYMHAHIGAQDEMRSHGFKTEADLDKFVAELEATVKKARNRMQGIQEPEAPKVTERPAYVQNVANVCKYDAVLGSTHISVGGRA